MQTTDLRDASDPAETDTVQESPTKTEQTDPDAVSTRDASDSAETPTVTESTPKKTEQTDQDAVSTRDTSDSAETHTAHRNRHPKKPNKTDQDAVSTRDASDSAETPTVTESPPKKTEQTDQDAVSTETPTSALIPFRAHAIAIVIEQQRRRSAWLRTFAFLLLIMVVVSICLAIYLLTNASQLAGSDLQKTIAGDREIRDRELDFIDRELKNIGDQISQTTIAGPHLDELINRYQDLRTRRNEAIDQSTKSIIESLKTPPLLGKNIDINALTVRVSSVILLIFLVQTFISVFRYLTRLAAFYNARRDALTICAKVGSIRPSDFEKLVSTFSPESYDFTRSKSPTEQAVELAKAMLARHESH
jgi:hypothetical protein